VFSICQVENQEKIEKKSKKILYPKITAKTPVITERKIKNTCRERIEIINSTQKVKST
jgi:hypothetical protein